MVNTNISDRYFRLERAKKIIDTIQGCETPERVPVTGLKICFGDFRGPELPDYDISAWESLSSGHDTYGGKNTYLWICGTLTIPESFAGKAVRLYVSTADYGWDESNPNFIVFLDGKITSAFDRNHGELLLTPCAKGGETFYLACKGFTAMHDCACKFVASLRTYDPAITKLYYDISVPLDICQFLDDNAHAKKEMEYLLNEAVNKIDLTEIGSPAFYASIAEAQRFMDEVFYGDFSKREPDVFVHGIGHTHLDIAWLWPMRQTREKTARTFANMMRYMDEYPEFKFMSSQACLYNWVKNDYPELFERMKQAVKDGRWEVEGGMWVEADCNLTSGEGFVRQFLYGKRFFQREFGVDCKILWLPDVFGYSAALPQILKKSGIDNFMTTKISWNNHDKIPYDTFNWRGIDGSEVFAHFITCARFRNARDGKANTTYNAYLDANQMMGAWERFQHKDICNEVLASIGYGDGGGGTSRDMLENGRRFAKNIPGAPSVHWAFAGEYFDEWREKLKDNRYLPKWVGELYLEFHRGTLTTMADNKKNNRLSEFLYQKAELFAYMDQLFLGGSYPKEMFDKNWELILTNQFHDILPGSSIREVYEDSARDYAVILSEGEQAVTAALTAMADAVSTEEESVVCFNDTGLSERSDVCTIDGEYCVLDAANRPLPAQIADGKTTFVAANVPAKGYTTFKLAAPIACEEKTAVWDGKVCETPFYTLTITDHGEIASLVAKETGVEFVEDGKTLNHLVAYVDRPYTYDAWEISPYYVEQAYEPETAAVCTLVENGPVSAKFRTVRTYGKSTITQTIVVYAEIARIDIENEIDWHEDHLLLRAHFPTTIHASRAVYDIQFGNIERETNANTSWEAAKFEVCAHKWADLSDGSVGLALMNNCKYGHRCLENELSISLLRSPTHPNPVADRGHHSFTYSLLAHEGTFVEGGVIREGYQLNRPLDGRVTAAHTDGKLPKAMSLVSIDSENVIIGAVKRAEDDGDLIVRLNEEANYRSHVTLTFVREIEAASVVSLMEDKVYTELTPEGNTLSLTVQPYEIVTLKVKLK
ncbi:MAG: alpha-mannosidase [Ruminococcaceae bacterium]|nr:alpha-mannosidase [Oscillospiraceae bacterium]